MPSEAAGRLPSAFAAFTGRDLVLPEAMRAELATPLGPVVRGRDLIDAVRSATPVVAVGDVVTVELHDSGRTPDIAIVDFRTKRSEDMELRAKVRAVGGTRVTLANPAGRIAAASWPVLLEAFKSGERVRVEVRGEEDLLALVAIALAPDGAAVVYGQPDEGAVVVRVDARARSRVAAVLARMQ